MIQNCSWHYFKIRRKQPATPEVANAARFLEAALADGPRYVSELMHEAHMYEISTTDVLDAAKLVGVVELFDPETHRLIWERATTPSHHKDSR